MPEHQQRATISAATPDAATALGHAGDGDRRALLLQRLAEAGGELPVAGGHATPRPGAAVLVSALLHEREGALPDLAPALAALADGDQAMLTIADLGACSDPSQAFENLLIALVAAGFAPSRSLGLCIADDALPLRVFALQSRCYLGEGPRYLNISGSEKEATWSWLWRHQSGRWAVWPAYGLTVTSQCPLLNDETANVILPHNGLRAPAHSRWLILRIDLNRYADDAGQIRLPDLHHALDTCLDCCEQLLDMQIDFANEHCDLANNRRVAFDLRGFGDLVRRQGNAASTLHALRSSIELATHIRNRLWERSRQLAQQNELLPAIARSHPVCSSRDDEHQRGWTARWQAAVERHAVRHRNLIVMSPYAVLPRDTTDSAAYADLLPLIGVADAHAFADPPALHGWNESSFRNFHLRARAIVTRHSKTSVIATRV